MKSYNSYSPKILSGIRELDDVLQDRTLQVRMLRKLPSETTKRYKQDDEMLKFQERLRDNLYTWGLRNGHRIKEKYHGQENQVEGVDHLGDRELDIWEPLFLVANMVDEKARSEAPEVTEELVSLSQEMVKQRLEDNIKRNETFKLLSVLREMLEEGAIEPVQRENDGKGEYYDARDVTDYFKHTEEFGWIDKQVSVTTRLKKVDITVERKNKAQHKDSRWYRIDREALEDWFKRFGIIGDSEAKSRNGGEEPGAGVGAVPF